MLPLLRDLLLRERRLVPLLSNARRLQPGGYVLRGPNQLGNPGQGAELGVDLVQ